MPRSIKNVDQRLIILKALLDIVREFCTAYFPGKRHGACVEDLLILCAIFVGQAEGRPLNTSKVADFVGMARPTVIRKLSALERAKVLERQGGLFTIRMDRVNSDAAVAACDAACKLFVTTTAKLSKLDT